MFNHIFFSAFLLVVFILPNYSFAYEKISQSAYQLSEDIYLFTLDFRFGYMNAEAWLPILAFRNSVSNEDAPFIGYKVTGGGESHAIVLSDAKVEGDYYNIPAGKNADFTLLVVHKKDSVSDSAPSIAVTEYNHLIKKKDEVFLMKANSDQLASYVSEL